MYSNVLDYSRLKTDEQKNAYAQLFEGLAAAAKENDFVILT